MTISRLPQALGLTLGVDLPTVGSSKAPLASSSPATGEHPNTDGKLYLTQQMVGAVAPLSVRVSLRRTASGGGLPVLTTAHHGHTLVGAQELC